MMRKGARSWKMKKIALTPGGQGTSTVNVKTLHKTPIGRYTIAVVGTSGSLSHSVTITVVGESLRRQSRNHRTP